MGNQKCYRGWLWWAVLLVLVGCRSAAASLPGEQEPPDALVQPLSLAEIYGATPAVAQRSRGILNREVAEEPDAEMLISAGAALYTVNCAPCHQQNGEGRLHRFPALNQNAFVTNQSPQPLIRTVLDGRGVMPAYAATLSDSEIAAILSYIRQAWNNDADVVTPTQVRELYAQR